MPRVQFANDSITPVITGMDTTDVAPIDPHPIFANIRPLVTFGPSYLELHGTMSDTATEIIHQYDAGLNMVEHFTDVGIVIAEGRQARLKI
ncbi:hypothetical protein D3C85_1370190 [compost metagenome]